VAICRDVKYVPEDSHMAGRSTNEWFQGQMYTVYLFTHFNPRSRKYYKFFTSFKTTDLFSLSWHSYVNRKISIPSLFTPDLRLKKNSYSRGILKRFSEEVKSNKKNSSPYLSCGFCRGDLQSRFWSFLIPGWVTRVGLLIETGSETVREGSNLPNMLQWI
jgi:hypothetical protein